MKEKIKLFYNENKKVVIGVGAFIATSTAIVVAGVLMDRQELSWEMSQEDLNDVYGNNNSTEDGEESLEEDEVAE